MSRPKITITVPGPVLPGTISTAIAKCGKANCSCQTDPARRHGPYYRWTGLMDGKQTTVTLTKREAEECSRRIKNWSRLQQRIALIRDQALASAPWKDREKG